MDRKKIILLVAALLVAAIAAFFARSLLSGAPAPDAQAVAPVQPPQVLVATRALPAGTIITQDSFRWQQWPEEMMDSKTQFTRRGDDSDNIAMLPGTVVRKAIAAGQPINKESLVAPGDQGFLAAALGPGMRAVTIPVSGLTGVAGFVFPGDRIDLVLTQIVGSADRNRDEGPPLKVSETIIRNLRVLATDNRVTPSTDEEGKTVAARTDLVTLEVTPTIAEKISVAQTIGTLSLSLRSLSDTAEGVEEAIASGQVKLPPNATPEQEEAILARLAQQPQTGKGSFSTGGDVSRFQRRTIPPLSVVKAKMDAQELELRRLQTRSAYLSAQNSLAASRELERNARQRSVIVNVIRGSSDPDEVPVGKRD